MSTQQTNYTQGYSSATVSSHALRTIHSDAAFLIPHIKPTDSILDVGCGPGSITLGFASLVPQGSVIGIDISDDILSHARNQLSSTSSSSTGKNEQPHLTFQKADLLAGLPFADESFDVVFSSQLFPHLNTGDLRLRALQEMRRVVRKGGILATRDAAELLFYPRTYGLEKFVRFSARARAGRGKEEEEAFLPGGEMPSLYSRLGFTGAPGGRMTVGAGSTVFSTPEQRKWYAEKSVAKLDKGDPYRESWRTVGIEDEEIEECRRATSRWALDEGAWYVALQCEVCAWK